ncbi:Uncharacterised protein [Mycobacteroides abscessus subsp. abscessus]|nr:Uncharacterised protein [Mycobacteroides abscessus subsp. abscessus]
MLPRIGSVADAPVNAQVFASFPARSTVVGSAVSARCTVVPVRRRLDSAFSTAALSGPTNEVVLLVEVQPARPAAVRVSAPAARNWRRFRSVCMVERCPSVSMVSGATGIGLDALDDHG